MAKRLLDRILVVDVEATCWDGSAPAGQSNDIIEIGVTVFDIASAERTDKRGVLVRPQRSTVSAFCTQLTTLTQEDVDGGVSFAEACALLRDEYRSHERVWASWGEYDRQQFERQCAALGVPYPFGTRHLNVKTLYSLVHALPHELGMAGALAHAGLLLEGTHHRGVDDAWNIAGLLGGLLTTGRG
ncbi:3'-5' exonuclease [Yinghuangia seranimata]|uniref:3'-5' exonuclease n=1 Tax=Yinghuangia seranimata TaxID=408067 RepID=UPI00248B1E0D|nr:3'-5' exonuclease [Yinghuangia seranimata]MDI2127302.1 3'-5' exonuclease [Yinghuangia seranimata]